MAAKRRQVSTQKALSISVPPSEVDVEGADTDSGGIENYPLDELLIRTEQRAIQDTLRRIDKGLLKLAPDFQREFLWKEDRQSRLVESVLMRIPLPVFYFAEDSDGSQVIVDGLQRLSTLQRFYKNELTLKLPQRPELDARKYKEISTKLQTRFEDGQLTLYLIGSTVPDHVRLDIFDRVNGGVPLTRQQMRNALYNGPATRLLKTLAESAEFIEATGGALSSETPREAMRDREAVNRFLAHYHLGWAAYGSGDPPLDFDSFLGRVLRDLNGKSTNSKLSDTDRNQIAQRAEAELDQAKAAFILSMRHNREVFGAHAFRKSMAGTDSDKRSTFNLALFEVFAVGLARHPSISAKQARSLRTGVRGLLKNQMFADAISFATAKRSNVHSRFRLTEEMLTKVLGAP